MFENDCSCERADCENEVVRFGTGDVMEFGEEERTGKSDFCRSEEENVPVNTGKNIPLVFEGRRRRYCRKRRNCASGRQTHRFSLISMPDT